MTAYDRIISDWSSDVCSSDLGRVLTLSYEFAHPEFCKSTTHECFGVYLQITRPLAVSSTDGYRLTFGYGTDTAPTKSYEQGVADWMTIESVLASNDARSEEHTSELQSLMRISYAVFCLKKK